MSLESFEAVSRLETGPLRELLSKGDTTERVWAAWALALALGDRIVDELGATIKSEPPVGLRRHLLKILAGFGETDLLAVFACDDPSPLVRGTACLLLLQTRQPGDRKYRDILISRLRSEISPDVQETIIRSAPENYFTIPRDVLQQVAQETTPPVRLLAFEMLVSENRSANATIEQCLQAETDPSNLLRYSILLAESGRKKMIAQCAASLDAHSARALIDYLLKNGVVLPWSHLQEISKRTFYYRIEEYYSIIAQTENDKMIRWLVAEIANGIPNQEYDKVTIELLEIIRKLKPKSISNAEKDLNKIIKIMKKTLTELKKEASRYMEDDYEYFIESLQSDIELLTSYVG